MSFAYVLLRFTNVDVSFASEYYVHKGDRPITECWKIFFPALDVGLATVILSFTRVDDSLARGILMFIGRGQT